jgi:Uncharacterized protein conserved in bacteria (DUF2314)
MLDTLPHLFVSWQALLVACFVFGFAPGAVLRLIVLGFRHDDPRRRELLAELHTIPRLDRPFWVFEQLEVALLEGVWGRVAWAATGRVIHRWHLSSGVERSRAHPDSFWIPNDDEKAAIGPGSVVKLMFDMRDGWGERMWVMVVGVKPGKFIGMLHNQPVGIPRLDYGDRVKFKLEHVIDIDWSSDDVIDAERLCGHFD